MKLTTTAASAILGIDRKAIDNILSREGADLLPKGRRGKSRQVPIAVLERLAIALLLNRDLGVSLRRAVSLAGELQTGAGRVGVGPLTALSFDIAAVRRSLQVATASTLEQDSNPKRGRPRQHPKP